MQNQNDIYVTNWFKVCGSEEGEGLSVFYLDKDVVAFIFQ